MKTPRVFISYSFDSSDHVERVRMFAVRLKKDRVDVRIDLDVNAAPPEGWPNYSQNQIQDADYVLLICTEIYCRRFEGREQAGRGHGITFEGRLIRNLIYHSPESIAKFIPVMMDAGDSGHIPLLMRDRGRYLVSEDAGYESLLRLLRPVALPSRRPQAISAKKHKPKTQQPRNPAKPDTVGTSAAPSTNPASPMNPPVSHRSIVWLHLSDLHNCRDRTGWDAPRVLRHLSTDLKKMEADHGLIPDLFFFTGDAAFGHIGDVPGSTLREQFEGAHQLLEGARTAFSRAIPQENVFIVPGNHDVDRREVGDDQTAWLAGQTQTKAITDLIHSAGKQWQRYLDRLAAYREFLTTCKYQHLLIDTKRLIYSQTRDIHGLRLGIAGFNSAWSCGAHDKKGGLWFGGDRQAGELLNELSVTDFRIALTHHPFGWFVEPEDTPLRILFEREFAFHLHGHEHLGWVDAKADGHVRIAAAACYDSSNTENGYNLVRLNLDTGEAEVWLRRFDAQGGGWVPRVISGKTNNDGLWRLGKLPWLQPLVAKTTPENPA